MSSSLQSHLYSLLLTALWDFTEESLLDLQTFVIAFRKVKKKKKNIVGKFRLEQNCGHSTIIDWYLIYGALASA